LLFRSETDAIFDNHGSYRGLLLGTGGMIALNSRIGIQLDLSGHYTPKYDSEKFLLEAGVGLIFSAF